VVRRDAGSIRDVGRGRRLKAAAVWDAVAG
jgi:hypothetical protein